MEYILYMNPVVFVFTTWDYDGAELIINKVIYCTIVKPRKSCRNSRIREHDTRVCGLRDG